MNRLQQLISKASWASASDKAEALRMAGEQSAPQAEVPIGAGLSLAQEPKYTVDGHSIINRASGEAIPADEPVFIFRARDKLAVRALLNYADQIGRLPGSGEHFAAVRKRVKHFRAFASRHPERMKTPDTTPTAPTPAEAPAGQGEAVCPACGSDDCKIIKAFHCNACKGDYFQTFGKADSRDIPAQQQPVSAEVLDALNAVDDFIARCNGDDRGSCESVEILRRALSQGRPA